MKHKTKTILITFSFFFIIAAGMNLDFVLAEDYPTSAQEKLVYDVINWEDPVGQGLDWKLFECTAPYGSLSKGNFSTSVNGKIEVDITGQHSKNQSYFAYEDIGYCSYGNIAIYTRNWFGYDLDFAVSNVSMNEMGYILLLGFFGWDPAFNISTDWVSNGAIALSKEAYGATVEIINETDTVTYKFTQDPAEKVQKTELTYNKASGFLLEAKTEFGLYKLHIRLQGYGSFFIPGYDLPILFTSIAIGVFLIVFKKRKTIKN